MEGKLRIHVVVTEIRKILLCWVEGLCFLLCGVSCPSCHAPPPFVAAITNPLPKGSTTPLPHLLYLPLRGQAWSCCWRLLQLLWPCWLCECARWDRVSVGSGTADEQADVKLHTYRIDVKLHTYRMCFLHVTQA